MAKKLAKKMTKKLFCIRHGEGWHNVNARIDGSGAYYEKENEDPNLTELGIKQARKLGETWKEKEEMDLIITSPLSRCIQTTNNIFKDTNMPIIAVDYVREYPASLQFSNRRKNKKYLEEKYSNIHFLQLIGNEDLIWDSSKNYETHEQLKYRTKQFLRFLEKREEEKIALVSHSTFLMNLLFETIDESEENELNHCFVYEKEL